MFRTILFFKPKSLQSLVLFFLRKEPKQHLIKLTPTKMLLSIGTEIRTVSKRANSKILIKEDEDDGTI